MRRVAWQQDLGGSATTPLVAGGVVYVGTTTGVLYALRR